MSHIGQFTDLDRVRSKSGHKTRYYCPYCDSIHNKSPDKEGCFVFDHRKQTGFCFRCHSQVVHEGLRDKDYIIQQINGDTFEQEFEQAENQKLRLKAWTTLISDNKRALAYMKKRGFKQSTLERFNIRACLEPSLGVLFPNKLYNDDEYTDFYQVRYVKFKYRHSMIDNLYKKACWLHIADSPRLIIVEGFSSGLAAYEHTLRRKGKPYLNPVIACGNSITDIQAKEIKDFCFKHDKVEIYICLDGGFFEHGLKIAQKLYQKCHNVDIYMTHLDDKDDPNDLEYWEFLRKLDQSNYYEPNRIQFIRNKVY